MPVEKGLTDLKIGDSAIIKIPGRLGLPWSQAFITHVTPKTLTAGGYRFRKDTGKGYPSTMDTNHRIFCDTPKARELMKVGNKEYHASREAQRLRDKIRAAIVPGRANIEKLRQMAAIVDKE